MARAEVFGSGHTLDRVHNITFVSLGGTVGNTERLRTRSGHRDVHLAVTEYYRVVPLAADPVQRQYQIRLTYYAYTIRDRDERELLAYHWHPEGVSDVTFPHLHIPRVAPIPLAQTDPPRAVAVGEMHLPTNRVLLEDVVELLIREFAVMPQRADWRDVLNENRAAFQHGRT